jgi:hypothetical protein
MDVACCLVVGGWLWWDEGNKRWRGTLQRRWKSEGKRETRRSRKRMRVVVVAAAVLVVLVLATTGAVAWLGCGCCCCCFSSGGMVILMRMQDAGVGEGQAKTSWVFSVLWGLVEGLRLVGIVVAGSRCWASWMRCFK